MKKPAAFGRLCVETKISRDNIAIGPPAAFGRLCVETSQTPSRSPLACQPPSGGCVLKLAYGGDDAPLL